MSPWQEQFKLTGADEESRQQEALKKRTERYSLSKEASRKKAARMQQGLEAPNAHDAFPDSRLVKGEEAMRLYNIMPLVQDMDEYKWPKTQLLFATWNNYPPLLSGFAQIFKEGEVGYGPTVVLVKCGDHVFGGYASQAWSFSGLYEGKSNSFLFSLTHDCKVPYTGRVPGPKQAGDAEPDTGGAGAGAGGDGGGGGGGFGGDGYTDDGSAMGGGGVTYDEYGNEISDDEGSMGGDGGGLGLGLGLGVASTEPRLVPPRIDAQRSQGDELQFGIGDLVIKVLRVVSVCV